MPESVCSVDFSRIFNASERAKESKRMPSESYAENGTSYPISPMRACYIIVAPQAAPLGQDYAQRLLMPRRLSFSRIKNFCRLSVILSVRGPNAEFQAGP